MTAYKTLVECAIEYRRNPFDNDARVALSAAIKAAESDIEDIENADERANLTGGAPDNRDIIWSR